MATKTKIDLDPCSTGHWWIQDEPMHVHCEYCPATGRVVLDGEPGTPKEAAAMIDEMFIEPIAQPCTIPGHACGTAGNGPCNGLPRTGGVL